MDFTFCQNHGQSNQSIIITSIRRTDPPMDLNKLEQAFFQQVFNQYSHLPDVRMENFVSREFTFWLSRRRSIQQSRKRSRLNSSRPEEAAQRHEGLSQYLPNPAREPSGTHKYERLAPQGDHAEDPERFAGHFTHRTGKIPQGASDPRRGQMPQGAVANDAVQYEHLFLDQLGQNSILSPISSQKKEETFLISEYNSRIEIKSQASFHQAQTIFTPSKKHRMEQEVAVQTQDRFPGRIRSFHMVSKQQNHVSPSKNSHPSNLKLLKPQPTATTPIKRGNKNTTPQKLLEIVGTSIKPSPHRLEIEKLLQSYHGQGILSTSKKNDQLLHIAPTPKKSSNNVYQDISYRIEIPQFAPSSMHNPARHS